MLRKVDPIHFFDALGQSVLSVAHQAEVIDRLAEENARLKRLLHAAMRRLDGAEDDLEHATRTH